MAAEHHVEVTLLTREDCAFCREASTIMGRLRAEFPLLVKTLEFDSEEGRRLALDGGLLFPPGILIGGLPFSYGRPSERKLRRELARLAGWQAATGRSQVVQKSGQ